MVASAYRPPSADASYYEALLDNLEQVVSISPFVLLADLNINYDWNSPLDNNPIHNLEVLFNLRQLITQHTRITPTSKTLLDIILTSNHNMHAKSGVRLFS